VISETERLVIRLATEEDVELFYALWTSPQVMVNVGFPQGLRITRDQIKDRLSEQEVSAFEQLLVVELKRTGQAIGECHLRRLEDEAGQGGPMGSPIGVAEPDVKLLPAFWGRGYGTEVWGELVAYAFTHTDCDVVRGTPNVKNRASIKMQASAGAVRVGEDVYEFPESMRAYTTPVHCYVYQVHRADWERRAAERRRLGCAGATSQTGLSRLRKPGTTRECSDAPDPA
jgi:RimJ/RimL family protein N-acetyltransferase